MDSAGSSSPSADDALGLLIQERLKSLRNRAGLTLEQLSKRSGVSRGMLSQIELGRSIPTVTVLSRIAGALEVPTSTFLVKQSEARVHVLRHAETQELRSPDGKYTSRALFPFSGERRTELFELRLAPDCKQDSAPHTTGTTENLVISQGSLRMEIAGSSTDLATGDSIFFLADVPHSYQNRGAAVAVAYLVMTYPQPVNY